MSNLLRALAHCQARARRRFFAPSTSSLHGPGENRQNSDQGDMTADPRRHHRNWSSVPRGADFDEQINARAPGSSSSTCRPPGFDFLIRFDQMIRGRSSFSAPALSLDEEVATPLRQPPWQIAARRIETPSVPCTALFTPASSSHRQIEHARR